MSNSVWFNCGNGVAGDMLLASLVDAGAEPSLIVEILNGLELDGWALTFEKTSRSGVSATRAIVVEHTHGDVHDHRPYRTVVQLLQAADIPTVVRERALHTFAVLAEAEAIIHGIDMDEVEFHEVGSVDSIIDVVGVCAALEVLGVDYISCSPIAVGHGTIKMEHGELPNPGPAVARMLADHAIPVRGVDIDVELCTPTGVALMIALADEFGGAPSMVVTATGHGAGARDIPGRSNVVQSLVGVIDDTETTDTLTLLETNVDDVSAEVISYTIGRLLESGALDAWAQAITMKKNREGLAISCLSTPELSPQLKEILLTESGALGVRISTIQREAISRDFATVSVDGHKIRIKTTNIRNKVEFDDAAAAARALNLPLREVIARAEEAFRLVDGPHSGSK
jgi:uncharacterized protein (TIGR00299 family) protein